MSEYVSISQMAGDAWLNERMRACASQQHHLGNMPGIEEPLQWVSDQRYIWASSPGWAEKWQYALDTHPPGENGQVYEPGKDDAVITDGDILATVQALSGPEANPAS